MPLALKVSKNHSSIIMTSVTVVPLTYLLCFTFTFTLKYCQSAELIVLSAPSINDNYYSNRFIDIIKFHINYAKIVSATNNVIVLADRQTIPYLTGGRPNQVQDRLPKEKVLVANVKDIWIRDFGTVIQDKPVILGYRPQYLSQRDSSYVQNSFLHFLKTSGIETRRKSYSSPRSNYGNSPTLDYYNDIYIDGGNVVYDFNNNAILTDRMLQENRQFSNVLYLKQALKNVLGYSNIVVITQYGNINEDTTGHADGLVSFIDNNTVAYTQIETPKQQRLISELRAGLGQNVKLVELPSYYYEETDEKNFASACGLHINALVTKNYIYMPTFGDDYENQSKGYTRNNDEKVYQIMQTNTRKKVVKVPVPHKVCILGGSVRCLSMQSEGPIADRLLSLAKYDD